MQICMGIQQLKIEPYSTCKKHMWRITTLIITIQARSHIQFPTPVIQYYSNKYHSNTKPTAIINSIIMILIN